MEPLVPPSILPSTQRFLDLLEQWNQRHALTALPTKHRFEELVQDACALLPFLANAPAGSTLADFGTGMGVPAIILALTRPDLTVYAIDKSQKKIAFVRQVALELGLKNLTPELGRAEAMAPLFADLGTAKAVGSLELLTGWWERHGKAGAPLLLLKGEEGALEPCPKGWEMETHPYHLPTRGNRTVLKLQKAPGI